ncbi:MAG: hypothetical protein K8R87_10390 [Verrucomicrobia bacterium]|nr:hypothetical protein [Verrucomicrobiota bacterium]
MNTLIQFSLRHLELWLRIVAVAQLALAALSLCLPRIMKWKPDIDRMSPLVRDVFEIHSWFIALTLVIWAVLTWQFAPEMAQAPTQLSRWLCAAIGIFWGIRCVLQWTHYSPSHWRGNPLRTLIHWMLFFGYAAWTAVYFVAALRK